jgi:hypothetical protein
MKVDYQETIDLRVRVKNKFVGQRTITNQQKI